MPGLTLSLDEHAATGLSHGEVVSPYDPYDGPHQHLADLMRRHDRRLARQLARRQALGPADVLGFATVGEQEVERLLNAVDDSSQSELGRIDREIEELEQRIESRVERSRAHGVRLPLVELARRFALTAREVDLLFGCLAVELDHRYERVYGFLHNDMSRRLASPGIATGLLASDLGEQLSARTLLGTQAPLRHYRMIELIDDGAAVPWISRSIRVDERIVSFITGARAIDPRIARQASWLETNADALASTPDKRDLIDRIVQLADTSQRRRKPLIYLHGGRHSDADAAVRGAARVLGLPVLTVDAELVSESSTDFEDALFFVLREGLLSQAAVYLRNIDRAFEPPTAASRARALVRWVAEMGTIVFASGNDAWRWPLPSSPVVLRIVELEPDGAVEQVHAWNALSKGDFTHAELHHLVSLHPLPVAAIRDVWKLAHALAGGVDDGTKPTVDHVRQACRAFAGAPASALARRIDARHRWDDLILPDPQLEQLAAICSQAKHASVVYGAWCFERRLSLGRGLNALFTGEPGTGKTMAAEVIATDLGVDLLKIDLSQIVSKYIGETEKNLRQLFDQAASANAILFFDEADALLGKRSDVKDAHDRYANTETAYLLQKMEEYPGITILATNLRQNIDAAFTRRMRFIVDFPFPEEEYRLKIWQSVWPSETPLGPDVDLALLARQCRLAGGAIRNVALAAAFLAAEQQQPVSMRHLMRATKRELQKMGRLVNDEEYRRYG
jgi:hypothetical protein